MISKKRKIIDNIAYICFFCASTAAIMITISIFGFVVHQGIRPFLPGNIYGTHSLVGFLAGTSWRPRFGMYGIGYMIASTLLATLGAVIVAVPISLGTAVFIAFYSPGWLGSLLKFLIECLVGIPSVFVGIFGFITLLPLISAVSPYPHGESLLAVVAILAVMSLPSMCLIMVNTFENASPYLKEASFALGASKRQAIATVIIPASSPGIMTAVIIGSARAIGETMAVALVAGNREAGILKNPFQTVRLLTTNIVMEQSYATELHAQLLWSTATVLLFFIIIINIALKRISKGATP